MQGNRAKHAILRIIINWGGDGNQTKKGFIPKETVFWLMKFSYKPFILPRFSFTHKKIIKPSAIRTSWVNRYYTYLLADKYIEHKLDEDGKMTWVTLTDKGVSAVSGNYFVTKQNEFKSILTRDICTVIVSLVTIITLGFSITKSNEESSKGLLLKQSIDSLKSEQRKLYQSQVHLQKVLDDYRLNDSCK